MIWFIESFPFNMICLLGKKKKDLKRQASPSKRPLQPSPL